MQELKVAAGRNIRPAVALLREKVINRYFKDRLHFIHPIIRLVERKPTPSQ
jgi:hypothetical protein